MRNYFLLLTLLIATALLPLEARLPTQQTAPAASATSPASQQPQTASPAAQNSPAPPAQAGGASNGPLIVLNPAHGGTDTGARGANGVVEKDVVIQFARAARAELTRQGFRVAMTRDDDSNPSYDDRDSLANGYRDAIFISLHVSSTGTAGTARAYYYAVPNVAPPQAQLSYSGDNFSSASAPGQESSVPQLSFVPWTEAQKPYVTASHRLADSLQSELVQRFPGSVSASEAAAVRELRSVAAPAVAVEISSVSMPNASSLPSFGASLATSVSHAILAFRPPGSAETK